MNILHAEDIYLDELFGKRGKGTAFMENSMGTLLIVASCVVVLLIGAVRNKKEWLINIVMRSILGAIAIYFINAALAAMGISLGVGINPVTILTTGILGIPGLLALYGIAIYDLM